MAESNESIEYVDRDREIEQIISEIEHTTSSVVKIVYARTAIGKSSLVSKLFMHPRMDPFIKIAVHTPPQNENQNANVSSFLNHIFDALFAYFDKPHILNSKVKNLSFESYILNNRDKFVRKDILNAFVDNMQRSTGKFHMISSWFFFLFKRLCKLGEFNPHSLVVEDTPRTRQLKNRYIKFVLSSARIALDIDNFQNIDHSSLRNIINWLNDYKQNRHFFVFEYTTPENDDNSNMIFLSDQLEQSGVKVSLQSVGKLPENYIVDVISKKIENLPSDLAFNVKLLDYYKQDASGNLRKLIDFSLTYNRPIKKEHNNPTELNLAVLSDGAKYIISVLSLSGGIVSEEFLKSVFCVHPEISGELFAYISELEKNMLVERQVSSLRISHASIIDAWKDSALSDTYDVLAYQDMEKALLRQLDSKALDSMHCDNAAWLKLLHIYGIFEPKKIDSLFNELENGLIDYISADNAWRYLKSFIDCTRDNIAQYKELYIRIVNICFECELYQEGFECLTLLINTGGFSSDIYLRELYAMFLSALDRHIENIEFCLKQLETIHSKTTRAYLNFSIILLTSYRSLNMVDKCKSLFEELIKTKDYRSYPEYGYLLRTTDMYMSKRRSAYNAYRSYRIFKKVDRIQAGKSLITLSYVLANLGHLHLAHYAIVRANRLLRGKRMGAHMFLVNRAAICLMRKKHGSDIYEMLNQAELSAKVSFDKLAIYINKLIWCYENKSFERANLIISDITRYLSDEPDKHIVAIAHYNLSAFYTLIGYQSLAETHYKLACELQNSCIPLKNRINKIKSRDTNVMCSKPWHACFLAYWTYDIFRDDTASLPSID